MSGGIVSSNCELSYAIQISNQPLINLFEQTYSGISGQQAWLNIPSNQILIAAGNSAEVAARWNLILIGIRNSLNPPGTAVCSTNLSNQIQLHDLLMLSLLPAIYQPTSCTIPSATAITASVPVSITTTNGTTGATNTVNVPTSNNISAPIQPLVQNLMTSIPAAIPITTQANMNSIQRLLATGSTNANGFAGTQSNQTLFGM